MNTEQKIIAVISHDRHRDDYVYIVKCSEEEIENYISKIWSKDFGFDPNTKLPYRYGSYSGDYYVETAIIREI